MAHMLDCVPLPAMDDRKQSENRKSARIFCNVPVQLQTSDGARIAAQGLDVNFTG